MMSCINLIDGVSSKLLDVEEVWLTDEPQGAGSPELAVAAAERHPAPWLLAAFAAGTAGSAAAKEVVRHLLRGCRDCSRAVREQLPLPAIDYDPVLDRAFLTALRKLSAPPPAWDDRAEEVLAAVAELAGLAPLEQGRRLLALARGLRRGAPPSRPRPR